MQIQIEIDGQPQTIDVPDDASPEEIDGLVNELNTPKKPYDPMNDAPRLPGEEGYVAPGRPTERSVLSQIGKYVSDYLGGLKDAATAPTAAPQPESLGAKVGDLPIVGPLYGAAESATTLATSAVAPALASARGALTGQEPTNADIEDFTYSPRSAPGAALNKVAGAAAKPVADLAEKTGADAALLPLAPELGGVRPSPRAPKAKPAAPNPAEPKTAARAAGYKLLPSEAGGGRISQAMESLAGPQLKKDFRRANEKATTKLAQEEIEAPAMNEKGFAKVREEGDAAYTAMEGIGQLQADEQVMSAVGGLSPRNGMRSNPEIADLQAQFESLLSQPWDAKNVVHEVRQLRKEANANSAPPAMGAKPDPKKQAVAKAQTTMANALDDWLERNAQAIGQPEIAKNYRAARTRLAKTASVERATAGGKTDVRNLERQDEHGVPHTGRLKVAAQTGEYFPESTGAVSGPDINVTPDSLFGSARQLLQNNLLRPVISAILRSEGFQNRMAPAPQSSLPFRDTGPSGPLAQYFEQRPETPYQPFAGEPAQPVLPRTQSESMRVAESLAGDLGLVPEGPTPDLPPAPSRMTADTPPPVRGDIPFTPSNLVGDLGLELEPPYQGQRWDRTFSPTNLAQSELSLVEDAPVRAPQPAGLISDLGLAPEGLTLDTVSPEGPFAFARGEPYTPDPRAASPARTATIREPGARGYGVERTVDLTSDLGLEPELQTAPDGLTRVMPAQGRIGSGSGGTVRPGQFEVAVGNDRVATRIPQKSLADELIEGTNSSPELGDLDSLMAELNQLALRQRPSIANTRSRVQNNASGESAASVEAINRVQSEKAAGQNRYLIDRDGTVTPLTGVDAVDAVARPGQVIVQRGVGAEPYTILDRGGLAQSAARGRVNAALSSLEGG